MITLFHCMSARSFRPLWMLEELGIPYALEMLPFPPRALQRSYLDVNPLGTIKVTSLDVSSFHGGELFNLLDWVTAVGFGSTYGTNFVTGIRSQCGNESMGAQDLDLPTLSGGFTWDTSLFASHGVIIVVPEPGRALLLLLGLMALFFRRRRNA